MANSNFIPGFRNSGRLSDRELWKRFRCREMLRAGVEFCSIHRMLHRTEYSLRCALCSRFVRVESLRMPDRNAFLETITWSLIPKMSTNVCFDHRLFQRSPASSLSFHMLFSRKRMTECTHFCSVGRAVWRNARRCSSMRYVCSCRRSCRAECVQVVLISAWISGRPQRDIEPWNVGSQYGGSLWPDWRHVPSNQRGALLGDRGGVEASFEMPWLGCGHKLQAILVPSSIGGIWSAVMVPGSQVILKLVTMCMLL